MKKCVIGLTVLFYLLAAGPVSAGYFDNVKNNTTHVATKGGSGSSGMIKASSTSGSGDGANGTIIETGDLSVMYWGDYRQVTDNEGSKMVNYLRFSRPRNMPAGWCMLGDTIRAAFPMLLVKDEPLTNPDGSRNENAYINGKAKLVPPAKFEKIYSIWGGNSMGNQLLVWKPIPPSNDYVALGLVGANYRRDWATPAPSKLKSVYRCVHKDLLVVEQQQSWKRIKPNKMWWVAESDPNHMGTTPKWFSLYMLQRVASRQRPAPPMQIGMLCFPMW